MPSQIKVDEIKNVAGQYKIKTNVLEGQTTAGSIVVTSEGTSATTNLQHGLAKSYITFDSETGSVSTKVSLNASSLTDNAEGDFTHNLPSAFASNTKFILCSSGTDGYNYITNLKTSGTITSSAIPIQTRAGNFALNDTTHGLFVFHGELA